MGGLVYEREFVQWVVRTLSFFNIIAFLWLGLAVLLNAQRRVAGTWITGGGLLLAGLFFALHSVLVGRDLDALLGDILLWGRYIWLLFVGPPFLWYLVSCWYSGALRAGIHRIGLSALGLIGLVGLIAPVLYQSVFAFRALIRGLSAAPPLAGGVSLVLAYPVYGALCYLLALLVLRRPGTSDRFMGDLGRRRARPWLVAASLLLLIVSLSVGSAWAWLFDRLGSGRLDLFSSETTALLMNVDMAVSGLLALAVVLLGRAIVSYEIFTGKTLPRSGLLRHWRNSLVLAAGYGALMGGSLGLPIEPIYRLVLATLLIALFYGLLSWRSYQEREQGVQQLRPFVGSQRLYEQLLTPVTPLYVDVETPFRALCQDVLGARSAHLVGLGPMAPLVGMPLSYPPGAELSQVDVGKLTESLSKPHALIVPLDIGRSESAEWAVPLWGAGGLVGALLLSEKRDGGLYVQEEIEIARATGERLLDTRATAEVARRLMAVQRQRLAETQVLDHRARRRLHDEVLPRVHAVLLSLSRDGGDRGAVDRAVQSLAEIHHQVADLLRELPAAAVPEVARLGVTGALQQAVESDLAAAFDGVAWQIEREAESALRGLPPLVAEVVYSAAREAIRNAALHGRGRDADRPLHLTVSAVWKDGLRIEIEDDGVGPGAAATTDEGSGQGLALHSTMMAVIGGTLLVERVPATRTRVSLLLPQDAYSQWDDAARPALA